MNAVGEIDLSGDRRRHARERRVRRIFLTAGVSSLLVSIGIVWALLGNTITFLTNIDLGQLWTTGWFPRRGDGLFDIKTLLVGTLITTFVAMLIAAPLGLASAIYLSEYASARVRSIAKPILELLASIPSVVIGFFAITFLNPEIIRVINPQAEQFNLAAAGLGIGLLITPLVASVSEDALHAVPHSLREASFGLGAKRATTSIRVVVPAAISGIVASMILAISRSIGETMVVAIASGATGGSEFTTDPFGPGQTITAAIASLVTGSDQVRGAGQAYNSLFFLGLLLFFLTLFLNLVGDAFVRRVQNKY